MRGLALNRGRRSQDRAESWPASARPAQTREKDGEAVYSMAFTAEEIDYLDTKAEGDALRSKQGNGPDETQPAPRAQPEPARGSKGAKGRKPAAATAHAALDEHGDPIPF